MYEKLFSIKVPSGWAIIHHSFGDEDPLIEDGVILNDEFYNEDLLSIEPIQFNDNEWSVDQSGYAIDLGWYPEGDPDGSYCLTLLKGDWKTVVFKVTSKNRYQVRQLIEFCFDMLCRGVDDQKIAQSVSSCDFSAA